MKFNIKKNDLVLEIGAGHNPHPRSDVLCDQFLFNNNQRSNFNICYDRPLLIAQGEKLPFKDKAFDYIICRQVIEHSPNPLLFSKEMERVGNRGVIVCPHAIREKLFGWKYHQWYIFRDKNKLIFIPKKEKIFSITGQFFHQLYQKKVFFRRFCSKNNNRFNIFYEWQGKIKIEIKNKNIDFRKWDNQLSEILKELNFSVRKDIDFYLLESVRRLLSKIQKEFKRLFWKFRNIMRPKANLNLLENLICCPICHSSLKINQKITCRKCGKKYSLIKGIPVLTIQT